MGGSTLKSRESRIGPCDNIDIAYEQFCSDRFRATSEKEIAALEKRVGARFSDDYRDYLLRYNGGFFDEAAIAPEDDRFPNDSLEAMFGIGASHTVAELGDEYCLRLWDGNDPPILFPIGRTTLGFFILLITESADDYGCIYLRTFGSPILNTENESFFLAEDIDEFFSLLEPREEDDR